MTCILIGCSNWHGNHLFTSSINYGWNLTRVYKSTAYLIPPTTQGSAVLVCFLSDERAEGFSSDHKRGMIAIFHSREEGARHLQGIIILYGPNNLWLRGLFVCGEEDTAFLGICLILIGTQSRHSILSPQVCLQRNDLPANSKIWSTGMEKISLLTLIKW